MRIEKLTELKELQRQSQKYRERLYTDKVWERYEDYWMNKYDADEQVTTLPVLVSDSQRQSAGLIGGEPRVEITTSDAEMVPAARLSTAIHNHLLRQTCLIEEMGDAVQDTHTLGTGFLIDGFGSQYGVHQDTPLYGFDSSRVDKDQRRIEYHDNVYDDLPWTLRAHPTNIFLPPGTVNLASAYGFFHRYVRHIDEVREDEKLMRKHRLAITPDGRVEFGNRIGVEGGEYYEALEDYVILYDWYDLRNNHRTTFSHNYRWALSDEVDEILIRLSRLNLHALIFNRNSRYFWGTSDFDFLENMSQEVNDAYSLQTILGHLQVPKGIYDKDKLEGEDFQAFDDAVKKMTSDEVMALIGIHGSPKDFIEQFNVAQPYDLIPRINQLLEMIKNFGLGIGENQRGLMAGGRHTKYEAQLAESHHDQTLYPRRKKIRNIILNIIRNRSELIYDFWTEPHRIKTYDARGNAVVVEFRGADLRGDYRLGMSLDSMRSRGHEEKVAEANMILAQSMPFVQMGKVNPTALYRQYMSRLDSDWDIDALMMGEPVGNEQAVPFDQYQQQFMQDMPQNEAGIQEIMRKIGGGI